MDDDFEEHAWPGEDAEPGRLLSPSTNADVAPDGSSVVRNKRGAQRVSCAECRRRKLKCDREVPCANCLRADWGHRCPNGTRKQKYTLVTDEDPTIRLRSRIHLLERILQDNGIPIPHYEVTISATGQPPALTGSASVTSRDSGQTEEPLQTLPDLAVGLTGGHPPSRRMPSYDESMVSGAGKSYGGTHDRPTAEDGPSRLPHLESSGSTSNRSPLVASSGRKRFPPFASPAASATSHSFAVPGERSKSRQPSISISQVSVGHDSELARPTTNHQDGRSINLSHVNSDAIGGPARGSLAVRARQRQAGDGEDHGARSVDNHDAGEKVDDEGEDGWKPSVGTLVLGDGGRSRYVGPTAASEWLNKILDPVDDPTSRSSRTPFDGPSTPTFTQESAHPYATQHVRPSSSSRSGESIDMDPAASFDLDQATGHFPPLTPASSPSYEWLRGGLPSREQATSLVGYYYRHYTWNYNVIPKPQFAAIFDAFYPPATAGPVPNLPRGQRRPWTHDTHPHKLALVFIILAVGTLFNFEMGDFDKDTADRYFKMCTHCLAISNFLNKNTMASLQTLHILVNYQLHVDRLEGADISWPIWGLAMRIIQAMGLHRDGAKWALPEQLLDDRRRIFWETHMEDVLQANCFGRPGGISASHYDVEFPKDLDGPPDPSRDGAVPVVGYSTMRYRFTKIANEVLDQVMTVKAPPYSAVASLYKRIAAFEGTIPFYLRCRPAMLANLTAFPLAETAYFASPPPNKAELRITLQQHGLALNLSESAIFLQRPFFAKALHENAADPSKSRYGEAFLAVVERCNIIIAIATNLHNMFPTIAPRHWFFAYHASSAAVCFASLAISCPRSPLAMLGLSQLQQTCDLYQSISRFSHTNEISLVLLNNLRQTAMNQIYGPLGPFSGSARTQLQLTNDLESRARDHDVDERSSFLIGLHTRLINRMNETATRSRGAKPVAARHVDPSGHLTPTRASESRPWPYPSVGNGLPPINDSQPDFEMETMPNIDGSNLLAQQAFDLLGTVWPMTESELDYDRGAKQQYVDWTSMSRMLGLEPPTGDTDNEFGS